MFARRTGIVQPAVRRLPICKIARLAAPPRLATIGEMIHESGDDESCTPLALSTAVDRLFDYVSPPDRAPLAALADLEIDLERQQRLRRLMLAGAIIASLLCWAEAPFVGTPLVGAPLLFAVSLVDAAWFYARERRLQRRRRDLLARMSPTQRWLGYAA
jgi:hypothetical protein